MYRITKVYADSAYDYPTQIQESIGDLTTSVSHSLTAFAATNLKVSFSRHDYRSMNHP